MTLRPVSTAVLAALTAVGVICGGAHAQRNELPVPIITASELTTEQRQQVKAFVERNVRLMESKDGGDVRRGREAMMNPVANRDPVPAVGFRLVYGETAAPHLRRIVSDAGEVQAINALIVAGTIATLESTAVLDAAQEDKRVAVRFGAFAAARRVFRAIELHSPAIAERDAIDFVQRMMRRIVKEADGQVFDAGVKALIAATEVRRERFDRLTMSAWKSLAEGIGQRIRTLPCDPSGDVFFVGARRGADAIGAAAPRIQDQLKLDVAASRSVLELGADLWAHAACCIESGHSPAISQQDPEEVMEAKRGHRAQLAGLVRDGRTLMYWGVSPITDAKVFEPNDPADWVREANAEKDRLFIRRVRDLLGPGGVCSGPPLNYPGDRFIKTK